VHASDLVLAFAAVAFFGTYVRGHGLFLVNRSVVIARHGRESAPNAGMKSPAGTVLTDLAQFQAELSLSE
jgi:hypothetical protein